MKFQYDKNRIFVQDESNKLIVEATFPLFKEGVVVVDHTYVNPSLRGQGIASKLMKAVCQYIDKQHLKLIATCPYAVVWLKRHQEYQYLIDEETQKNMHPECKI